MSEVRSLFNAHILEAGNKLGQTQRMSSALTETGGNNANFTSTDNAVLFDKNYYNNTYSDVAESSIDPFLHFSTYGWKEHRNPSPDFDSMLYTLWHEDVRGANINAFEHYVTHGKIEGRMTFRVESSLARIIRDSVVYENVIEIDNLQLMQSQLYAAAETDFQRAKIAEKLCDWHSVIKFYSKALRTSLHDSHLWTLLSQSLKASNAVEEAAFALEIGMRFGLCAPHGSTIVGDSIMSDSWLCTDMFKVEKEVAG